MASPLAGTAGVAKAPINLAIPVRLPPYEATNFTPTWENRDMNLKRICNALALVAIVAFAPPSFAQDERPGPDTRSPQEIQRQQQYNQCRTSCNSVYAACGDQAVRDGRGQEGVNQCVPAYNSCNRRCEAFLPPS